MFHAHRVLPTLCARSSVPGSTAVASVSTAHRVHVSCITALRRRRQGHPSNAGIDTANAARSKSKPPIEVLDPCARMRTKARMRTNARMRAGSRRRVHAERMSCGSTSRYPAVPHSTLRYLAVPAVPCSTSRYLTVPCCTCADLTRKFDPAVAAEELEAWPSALRRSSPPSPIPSALSTAPLRCCARSALRADCGMRAGMGVL